MKPPSLTLLIINSRKEELTNLLFLCFFLGHGSGKKIEIPLTELSSIFFSNISLASSLGTIYYSWTYDIANILLAAIVTGYIPSFSATNNTDFPL